MKVRGQTGQMVASGIVRLVPPRAQQLRWAVLQKLQLQRLISTAGHAPYDLVVVGGGIVGMATAREVALRYPSMRIAVAEKEKELATHQTGHNSGVIHTGIYYTPGSLKARLCVRGADMLYDYCERRHIPYNRCGKVIVAVEDSEIPRLQDLYNRGKENNVRGLRLIGPEELKELEPHCRGKAAIHSPYTGIVDYATVARSYAEDFKSSTSASNDIYTGFEVEGFASVKHRNKELIAIRAKDKPILTTKYVITCCGLHSDRVAQLSSCSPEPRIVPFRGEYLLLHPNKCHLVRGNIYPVPDPRFPFLGVHFTPRMDGSVWLGPNAILAFSREGYHLTDFNWRDLKEFSLFRGLRKLVLKHWKFGSVEMYKSAVMAAQLKQLQKYVPEIQLSDITRGPSGVRAQALDNDGTLIDDFVFDQGSGTVGRQMLHVRNAPSPAATSSLAIAEMVADKAEQTFYWR